EERLSPFDAIWCVPNSPYASMEGALCAIRFARESGRPFLGTCGGFQHTIIEYARNVLGFHEADHAESNPAAALPLISRLACFLLLVAAVLRARGDTDSDPLPMLVHVLRGTADPELQLDILRGLSAAFKGRRQVPMPKGWQAVEAQLQGSPNADVRSLAQSLSL